ARIKARSIEALRRLKMPAALKSTTTRRRGTERTVYRVKAVLVSMRREDDSDIHLVITDPKLGGSMIVEFPATGCTVGAEDAERHAMAQARSDLTAACGGEIGSTSVTLTGRATITGVGFFDLIHGQAGVAPNGVELHPALSFSSADCTRTATSRHG